MARAVLTGGVTLDVPDHAVVRDLLATPRAPRGLAPAPPVVDPIERDLVAGLGDQELTLLSAVEVTLPPAPPRALGLAGTPPPGPQGLQVPLGPDEDAVVLVEEDGLLTWHHHAPGVRSPATRRRGLNTPDRQVRFALDLAAPSGRGVGLLGGAVRRLKAWVFRFVATLAVEGAVRFYERHVVTGLVHVASRDLTTWAPIDGLHALDLPTDRPARLLLLVHGTFSSTVGSYGALALTGDGGFLDEALQHYDAVVGFDHTTLGDDPEANATVLLARLEATAGALDVHAVAYSRGALVLRSLTELLLPRSLARTRVTVSRQVFVGGTNGGTLLARPERWDQLVTLTTNVVAASAKVLSLVAPATAPTGLVVQAATRSLGALVKVLATTALDARHVPGLAAMVPDGPFVTALNEIQEGQAGPDDVWMAVITSTFDVPRGIPDTASGVTKGFALWLADHAADGFMAEANDLVVHVASMGAIDPGLGGYVDARLDLPPNGVTYHTVYFARAEVQAQLTAWLIG